jgi:hypothetical protein
MVCKFIGNDLVHRDVTLFVERTYYPASSGPHRNKVRIHEPTAGPPMSDPVGKFKLRSSTFHITVYLCGIDHVHITSFESLWNMVYLPLNFNSIGTARDAREYCFRPSPETNP